MSKHSSAYHPSTVKYAVEHIKKKLKWLDEEHERLTRELDALRKNCSHENCETHLGIECCVDCGHQTTVDEF